MFECAALTYRVYKINPDFFFFKKTNSRTFGN